MKNKTTLINVPEIEKMIKAKHKLLLKEVGTFSHKISDDHQLLLTRMVARITRIVECFIDEGIIDEFTPYSLPFCDDEYIRAFRLKKKGFSESVYLWTDGREIIAAKGYSSDILTKFGFDNISILSMDSIDNFDGIDFSKNLIDLIHRKIYSRKESYDQKIFGIGGNNA